MIIRAVRWAMAWKTRAGLQMHPARQHTTGWTPNHAESRHLARLGERQVRPMAERSQVGMPAWARFICSLKTCSIDFFSGSTYTMPPRLPMIGHSWLSKNFTGMLMQP